MHAYVVLKQACEERRKEVLVNTVEPHHPIYLSSLSLHVHTLYILNPCITKHMHIFMDTVLME